MENENPIETVNCRELWRIWRNREIVGNAFGYPANIWKPTKAVSKVLKGRLVEVRERASHDEVYLVDNAKGDNPVLIGTVSPVPNDRYLCQPMGIRKHPSDCRAEVYSWED